MVSGLFQLIWNCPNISEDVAYANCKWCPISQEHQGLSAFEGHLKSSASVKEGEM